jgi:hypothetical protein
MAMRNVSHWTRAEPCLAAPARKGNPYGDGQIASLDEEKPCSTETSRKGNGYGYEKKALLDENETLFVSGCHWREGTK